MKYIVVTALLFARLSFVFAQNEPTAAERVKVIKLVAEAGPDMAPFPIGITGIRIIPLCGDTARLGYVQVGMMNKRSALCRISPGHITYRILQMHSIKACLKIPAYICYG